MTAEADTDATRPDPRWLADEQAALRRVATLVAEGSAATTLFEAVAVEVADVVGVTSGSVSRFFPDGSSVVLASHNDPGFPVGSRWQPAEGTLNALILETGRPVRIDQSELSGSIADASRLSHVRSVVGVPIVVEGGVWGMVAVGRQHSDEPLPPETEARLAAFTELVATAIANAESHEAVARLADEQAALRRVATLVAQGVPPAALFTAVTKEVERVFSRDEPSVLASVIKFDPGPECVLVGASRPYAREPIGSRWAPRELYVSTRVLRSGRSARVDEADLESVGGADADVLRLRGFRYQIGSPVVVDGHLWGAMTLNSSEALPPDTDERLESFTDLVATAIANAESRDALARLADEQSALRRVAMLVAEGATTATLAAAVVEEVVAVLGVPAAWLIRYEPERIASVAASINDSAFPVGSRWPLEEGSSVVDAVFDTGLAARVDDFSVPTGPIATQMRAAGFSSAVAVPIIVNRTVWGAVRVATRGPESLPADTVERLSEFTELVATAVLNAESRDGLSRLADEQAALRRVATLVAEGAPPDELFSAVASEVRELLGVSGVVLDRYDSAGRTITTLALELEPGWATGRQGLYVGANFPLEAGSLCGAVYETRRAARINDYSDLVGANGDAARKSQIGSSCGTPIDVDGRLWGTMSAFSRLGTTLPEGTEQRLQEFTEILATALSNIDARDEQRRLAAELIASRKRIIAAGDEARRRIERNLHDGTQQRLIALGFDLQRVRAALADDQADARAGLESAEQDLESVLEEVRELSRGLHPPLLSRRGLGPSVAALARRSPIPVEVQFDVPERPGAEIEIAVYYAVSEALTNAVRHSQASSISVGVRSDGERLQATIADDGVGGAEPSVGSGLIGLVDRVDALGGRIVVESPPGDGTRISIELPTPGV